MCEVNVTSRCLELFRVEGPPLHLPPLSFTPEATGQSLVRSQRQHCSNTAIWYLVTIAEMFVNGNETAAY